MIRPPMLQLDFDELIVDSFAGGGGASQGIQEALGRGPDIAINHDAEAIALHAANHPHTKHYQESVWKVDPKQVCGKRRVGLMWLSPDCKHFSKAKGGKPVEKKIRGLAWLAVRWAEAVRPRVIVLENVEEFQTWGPLLADGTPCPARKGHTFRAFKAKLRRLGYAVEHRELRACDYGAPTIRKRLFLIARCDGQPIRWPAPTHGRDRAEPWRTAAECIDWALVCPSIFERAKPLAENTLKRIARGIRRYVVETDRPFIVGVGGRASQSPERDLDRPYQTITTKNDAALVVPHLVGTGGPSYGGKPVPVDRPIGALTAENHRAVVAPLLVPTAHAGGPDRSHPVDAPMRTIAGHRGDEALIAASLIQTGYGEDKHRNAGAGQPPRALDIEKPLGTVVGSGVKHAVVAAFMAQHNETRPGRQGNAGHSMDEPVSTVIGKGCTQGIVAAHLAQHNGDDTPRAGRAVDEPPSTIVHRGTQQQIVTSHLLKFHGSAKEGRQLDLPLPTVRAMGTHLAEVRAFLVSYYGTEQKSGNLFQPAPTVTSKDRFGLVTVKGIEYVIADIGMRMLAPRELYRAQGFPESYAIDIPFNGKPMTKTAQVRMCGNSVCPPLARAIILAQFMGESVEVAA